MKAKTRDAIITLSLALFVVCFCLAVLVAIV